MDKIKVDRINELGRLAKTRELTEEEKREQKALREEFDHSTVVMIAQRIASVRSADRIAVIEKDGRILHCAPHDELMQISPTYREIYFSQMKKGGEAHE